MTQQAKKQTKTLRLRKRAEFLAMRSGEKRRGKYFLMEVKQRDEATSKQAKTGDSPRIGFTVTKKNGNAVIRNRIRRRLKAAAALTEAAMAPQTDYVVVARRETLNAPFSALTRELSRRFKELPNKKA
ncbi:ribonuclease P protein component [Pseudochrobactrum kiredjianiae]|uniref:Ribonuclease P protein component n=1 Tax=Pseudochrobactrum kiredjianiae TaxID=386305 RepID=A0ABW3UYS2_9HYPH|nr:ribonuclease P protein component [Pseudochrobactrum kiredjianiae]MDM7852179.1 ribonuclease P protein component [Pseudochrobactrum kiredjianiae]